MVTNAFLKALKQYKVPGPGLWNARTAEDSGREEKTPLASESKESSSLKNLWESLETAVNNSASHLSFGYHFKLHVATLRNLYDTICTGQLKG